jgi:ABC-type bacteriocin/lantibiotic exporter with double-glycine peptidase domain
MVDLVVFIIAIAIMLAKAIALASIVIIAVLVIAIVTTLFFPEEENVAEKAITKGESLDDSSEGMRFPPKK